MDRRQLAAFQQVAQFGSVTRAAVELGYSQSAVTAQIKALETILNTRLFHRTSNGVRLTARGERFMPYATRILRLAAEAMASIVAVDNELSGTLAIGANETITSYRFPPLVKRFHERYPKVRLSLRVYHNGAREILRSLATGEIDVALFHSIDVSIEDVGLTRVLDEDIVLATPPCHPRVGVEVDIAELRRMPLLIAGDGCVYSKIMELEPGLGEFDLWQTPPFEFGTLEAVKNALVSAEFGVAVLPRVMIADLLADGRLHELSWKPATRVGMYAAWAKQRDMSEQSRLLISLLTSGTRRQQADRSIDDLAALVPDPRAKPTR